MLTDNSCIRNEHSVLLLDGWKNTAKNEKYVVGILHNALGEKLFLHCWDFTDKSETASSLIEVVEEARVYAKDIYNTDIYAVVTDNASAMTCMGKNIELLFTTCSSHSGNLLAKSMVESSFTEKITIVLKEFKSSRLESQFRWTKNFFAR